LLGSCRCGQDAHAPVSRPACEAVSSVITCADSFYLNYVSEDVFGGDLFVCGVAVTEV
jgi:hypothetical protein